MPQHKEHCIVHPPDADPESLYVEYLATLIKKVNIVSSTNYVSTNTVSYDYAGVVADLLELSKKYGIKK